MKSPFPGMDPYLEDYWREVHQRLVIYAGDWLQSVMPPGLRVRVEERVFVESDVSDPRAIYPDVYVVEHGPGRSPHDTMAAQSEIAAAVAEPVIVDCAAEPLTQGYIEIIDLASGNRVITVIEFVSPSNKVPGPGRDLYLQKQRETIEAGASFVEIDLTRTGRRELAFPMSALRPKHRTTYTICVRRAWRRGKAEVYPVRLEQRLPIIRIPLRETDHDATLDVQALVDQAYLNGRYDDLDYRADPAPPLAPPDAAWADGWLREKGVREARAT